MNSFASHAALREAQIRYDLMEDDSWEDGDPVTAGFDELIADANVASKLAEQKHIERATNRLDEVIATAVHLKTLLQDRID